jgi:hypothetical protein
LDIFAESTAAWENMENLLKERKYILRHRDKWRKSIEEKTKGISLPKNGVEEYLQRERSNPIFVTKTPLPLFKYLSLKQPITTINVKIVTSSSYWKTNNRSSL